MSIASVVRQSQRRLVLSWQFENGTIMELILTGEMDTERALKMLDILIAQKRDELAELQRIKPLQLPSNAG